MKSKVLIPYQQGAKLPRNSVAANVNAGSTTLPKLQLPQDAQGK